MSLDKNVLFFERADKPDRPLAIVAFGSNVAFEGLTGPALLHAAGEALADDGLKFVRRSSLWISPAWPDPADPPFVNACALVEAPDFDAAALMVQLHRTERAFGRVRGVRNAPRTLDLDLIDFPGAQVGADGPHLPHPRMHERAFVLAPLLEVAPDWRHPVLGLSVDALLAQAPARAATQRLAPWAPHGV